MPSASSPSRTASLVVFHLAGLPAYLAIILEGNSDSSSDYEVRLSLASSGLHSLPGHRRKYCSLRRTKHRLKEHALLRLLVPIGRWCPLVPCLRGIPEWRPSHSLRSDHHSFQLALGVHSCPWSTGGHHRSSGCHTAGSNCFVGRDCRRYWCAAVRWWSGPV